MKYKVNDRVRIKSIDWYNENKDKYGQVFGLGAACFNRNMSCYCGSVLTIDKAFDKGRYRMKEDDSQWIFTDEMIEGLVEEETKPKYEDEVNGTEEKIWIYQMGQIIHCPDGYIFKDENGNEILTNKIILEKVNTLKTQSDNMETETHRGHCTTEPETTSEGKKVAWFTFYGNDFADKVELDLSNRELIQEDGKWFVVKKKKEYPETYEECCKVLGLNSEITDSELLFYYPQKCGDYTIIRLPEMEKFEKFIQLYLCRNAYWKIAGDEMGLGKPWEPDWNSISDKYCIYFVSGDAWSKECQTRQCPFAFPTAEMRDAFYENFKELIESVKELL